MGGWHVVVLFLQLDLELSWTCVRSFVVGSVKDGTYRLPLQAFVFFQLDPCPGQVPIHRPGHKRIVVLQDVW